MNDWRDNKNIIPAIIIGLSIVIAGVLISNALIDGLAEIRTVIVGEVAVLTN